jgi:hypothetical protein
MQNEWYILNMYDFSLSAAILLFAANGWGWTLLKDSKKPILCGVIGPRLVRICQLSVSAGQLAELCVHTAGICMLARHHGFGLENIKYRPGFPLKIIKQLCSPGTARILQV